METHPLVRGGHYPCYLQIRLILLDRITNGIYGYGELLPSESALAQQFSVSRLTVRKALELLKREKVITSTRGVGWTVVHHRIEQRLTSSYWFGIEIGDTGTPAESEVLVSRSTILPQSLSHYHDSAEELQVYEIIRARIHQGQPISLEFAYIPKTVAPGIDEKIHRNPSLIWLLEHEYAIAIGRSTEYLRPHLSDPFESEQLGMPYGSPVFETLRITRDVNLSIIQIRRSIIRGDKVLFINDFS